MGSTADKLRVLAHSKQEIKWAMQSKGLNPDDNLASYGEEIRKLEPQDYINRARTAEVVAKDKIKVGDTVYTVGGMTDYSNIGVNSGSLVTFNIAFSPDSSLCVLEGESVSILYSVKNDDFSPMLEFENMEKNPIFSPNGDVLLTVLGGTTICIYSVNGLGIEKVGNLDFGGTIAGACYSPDSKFLIVYGAFDGYAKVYTASGTSVTYLGDVPLNSEGDVLDNAADGVSFLYGDHIFLLSGQFTGGAKTYRIADGTISYLGDVFSDANGGLFQDSFSITPFLSKPYVFLHRTSKPGFVKLYSTHDGILQYVQDIDVDENGAEWDGYVNVAIHPGEELFVLYGSHQEKDVAKWYTFVKSEVVFRGDIYADSSTGAFDGVITKAYFSIGGNVLILSGQFTAHVKSYRVGGGVVSYAKDATNIPKLTNVIRAAISPNARYMVIATFTSGVHACSISETSVRYVKRIQRIPTMVMEGGVRHVAHSSDGKLLVCVGEGMEAVGFAKLYAVRGSKLDFLEDIPADTGGAGFDDIVSTAMFSPDDTMLVVGGEFGAKLYSVQGQHVNFLGDIYADADGTPLGPVHVVKFSPDGKRLVIGGGFSGYAKFYEVQPLSVSYLEDILGGKTEALDGDVYDVVFENKPSTDSSFFICGDFTGKVKRYVYHQSSTLGIYYSQDVYEDGATTPFQKTAFSMCLAADKNILLIGGDGFAKMYSVSTHPITYLGDIPPVAEGTPFGTIASISCNAYGVSALCDDASGSHFYHINAIGDALYLSSIEDGALSGTFAPDSLTYVSGGACLQTYMCTQNDGPAQYVLRYDVEQGGSISAICALSHDEKTLACAKNGEGLFLYSVDGVDLRLKASFSCNNIMSLDFSPDDKHLWVSMSSEYSDGGCAIGIRNEGGLWQYYWGLVDLTTQVPLGNPKTNKVICSPDGNWVVAVGAFDGYAKAFQWSQEDNWYKYVCDLCADNEGTPLSGEVTGAAFSPDGSLLVLGGNIANGTAIYTVGSTSFEHIGCAVHDNGSALNPSANISNLVFSPSGDVFVLKETVGRMRYALVNETSIVFKNFVRVGDTIATGTLIFFGDGNDAFTIVGAKGDLYHINIGPGGTHTLGYAIRLPSKYGGIATSKDGQLIYTVGTHTRVYQLQPVAVPSKTRYAYQDVGGQSIGDVGYALSDMEPGETGKAKLFASIATAPASSPPARTANIAFYDWDDTHLGTLTVPVGQDCRRMVNNYVSDHFVHPDLRIQTAEQISSIERMNTYRGKYPAEGPDGLTVVENGTDFPLTNHLDYVFYGKSIDVQYPYVSGWVNVGSNKVEDVWTTVGVGPLENSTEPVSLADFSSIYGDIVVKAAYKPGALLKPYTLYTQTGISYHLVGASGCKLHWAIERVDSAGYGTQRAEKPAFRLMTCPDTFAEYSKNPSMYTAERDWLEDFGRLASHSGWPCHGVDKLEYDAFVGESENAVMLELVNMDRSNDVVSSGTIWSDEDGIGCLNFNYGDYSYADRYGTLGFCLRAGLSFLNEEISKSILGYENRLDVAFYTAMTWCDFRKEDGSAMSNFNQILAKGKVINAVQQAVNAGDVDDRGYASLTWHQFQYAIINYDENNLAASYVTDEVANEAGYTWFKGTPYTWI